MIKYLVAPVALIAASHAASAATITYSQDFDSSDFSSISIPNPETTHTSIFSLVIDQFDPALGTLNSVTLAFEFTFRFVGNTGPDGGSFGFGGGGNFYISGLDDSIYGYGGGTGNGGAPDTDLDFGFIIGQEAGSYGQFSNPGFVDAFLLGTGSRTISFVVPITLSVGELGTTTGVIDMTSGSMSLTYDYTPAEIPESSTFAALAGLGALGCASLRRSRHRSA
jgi:hypothetical protein